MCTSRSKGKCTLQQRQTPRLFAVDQPNTCMVLGPPPQLSQSLQRKKSQIALTAIHMKLLSCGILQSCVCVWGGGGSLV